MMLIRPLELKHNMECFAIWRGLDNHYEHPVGGQWTEASMQMEILDHHGIGVFNEIDDELIAYCLYRRQHNQIEIMLLATKSRWQRTGAMRALIQSLISELKNDERIWLEVHAGNLPAISLYESLGFICTGERKDYYSDGGKALLLEYKSLQ